MNGDNVNHIMPGGNSQPLQFQRPVQGYPVGGYAPQQQPQIDEKMLKQQEEQLKLHRQAEAKFLKDMRDLEAQWTQEDMKAQIALQRGMDAEAKKYRQNVKDLQARVSAASMKLAELQVISTIYGTYFSADENGDSKALKMVNDGFAQRAGAVRRTYNAIGEDIAKGLETYFMGQKDGTKTLVDRALEPFGWVGDIAKLSGPGVLHAAVRGSMGVVDEFEKGNRARKDIAELVSDRVASYLVDPEGGDMNGAYTPLRTQIENYLTAMMDAGKHEPGSKGRSASLQAMGGSIMALRGMGVSDLQINAMNHSLEELMDRVVEGRMMAGAQAAEAGAEAGSPLSAGEMRDTIMGEYGDIVKQIRNGVSASRQLGDIKPEYAINTINLREIDEAESLIPRVIAKVGLLGMDDPRVHTMMANLDPELKPIVMEQLQSMREDIKATAYASGYEFEDQDLFSSLHENAKESNELTAELAGLRSQMESQDALNLYEMSLGEAQIREAERAQERFKRRTKTRSEMQYKAESGAIYDGSEG